MSISLTKHTPLRDLSLEMLNNSTTKSYSPIVIQVKHPVNWFCLSPFSELMHMHRDRDSILHLSPHPYSKSMKSWSCMSITLVELYNPIINCSYFLQPIYMSPRESSIIRKPGDYGGVK